jgi:hypothetical protein
MVFSDTSSLSGIIQRCEDYTGIGNGNISGDTTTLKKFTSNINEGLYEIIIEIMKSQDEFDWDDHNYTDYPIGTAPLAAGQRDYILPSSIKFLTIKRLDVTYDGTNWYQARPIDSSEMTYGLGNAAKEDAHFTKTDPRYDPKANGFWLYPMASAEDVEAAFRIEFTREFDEFTTADTTQEPPIDRPFHDLVPISASLKWAVMKDAERAKNLKVLLDEGIEKLKSYYGKRNTDSQLVFNPYIPNYK